MKEAKFFGEFYGFRGYRGFLDRKIWRYDCKNNNLLSEFFRSYVKFFNFKDGILKEYNLSYHFG